MPDQDATQEVVDDDIDEGKWLAEDVAGRLSRLSPGEGEVIWTAAAGLVRARRLPSGNLWEFRPVTGRWSWVMVGRNDRVAKRWKVTFSDGHHEPQLVYDDIFDAHGALWEAVEFLGRDKAVRDPNNPAPADSPAVPYNPAGDDAGPYRLAPLPIVPTDVTGLPSAIAYAEGLSAYLVSLAGIRSLIPSPDDVDSALEAADAYLVAAGVAGDALTHVRALQETLATAFQAVHVALSCVDAAAQAAQRLLSELQSHLAVRHAYTEVPAAGAAWFVQGE